MPKNPFFGSTGKFPQGKLNPADEGELQFGVAHHNGNVIINFGKSVSWLALPPNIARDLAVVLVKHADEIEGKAAAE